MPIGDLLASITGEKPATSPTTLSRPNTAAPKRKAEDELRGPTTKTPRAESAANGTPRPNGTSSKPLSRLTDRFSSTTTARKPSTTASNLSTRPGTSVSRAPATASSKPTARPAVTSNAKSIASRPAANNSATGDTAQKPAPTKKGSFAEIMARAKANTAVRESFGKIQHKTTEKGLTMKERKELKAEEARQSKKGARPARPVQPVGRNGTASLVSRPGASTAGHRAPPPPSKPGLKPSTTSAKGKSNTGSGGEEKKVKKAALATTGYTGTARPRPGAKPSQSGSSLASQRSGGARLGSGYGGSLSARKRRDDYDDELDDFIEYDDEEEDPYGGRPRYDSYEDESDMEAGLTDIDEEERRAEMIARKEDLEQEALELKMKQEKERKKLLANRGGR